MTYFLALWAPVFSLFFDYIGFESLSPPSLNRTSSSDHSTIEWLRDRLWLGRGVRNLIVRPSYFYLHPSRLDFASDVSLRIRNRVLTLSAWSFFVFRHGRNIRRQTTNNSNTHTSFGAWSPVHTRARRQTCRQGCQVRANGAVHASHNREMTIGRRSLGTRVVG